jgi:hypothetical protein
MFSFKVKKVYIFGDCSKEDFYDKLGGHKLVTTTSVSQDHFSAPISFKTGVDGAIFSYSGSLSKDERLDVKWCYQNGVPLVVWDKNDSTDSNWLQWHSLSVFTRKERVARVLLTSLGLIEQA